MSEKILMEGNEAIAEAAIRADLRCYFGYPITPQSELPAYLSKHLPDKGGVFLQAESEVAAINMVYGAASSGVRTMTSSSSPGISLKQEGISYLVGSELPCVIVNIVRGGPGLGNLGPSQSDYFQATKGGGHGDYKMIVLAPSSVQEAADLTVEAFDLADRYRNPVMILGDGLIGQMMEPVEFNKSSKNDLKSKPWATTGVKGGRKPNVINSLHLDFAELERVNIHLQEKFMNMQKELKYEEFYMEDADIAIVAYGSVARIAKTSIEEARKNGMKIGLIRPITLYPFPSKLIEKFAAKVKFFLVVELNAGQMIEDVKLAVNGKKSVYFHGRMGGMVPSPMEILEKVESFVKLTKR